MFKRPSRGFALAALLVSSALPSAFAADPAPAAQCVIIAGLGGAPEYDASFGSWASRLADVLSKQGGMECRTLTAGGKGTAQSTLDSVRGAFNEVAARSTPQQDLFIFLIGHGSYLKGAAKLDLPGPDLSAEELKKLVDAVPCRRAIVIDGASSSAPFINALSGPNRIVVAATKSPEENNATQFMGGLVEALEKGGADQNRDERVSISEAVRQASALTAAWYVDKGWMMTEHALLDDNGDGLGTRPDALVETPGPPAAAVAAPASPAPDGAAAAVCYLIQRVASPQAPPGAADAYAAALAEVEAFKLRKPSMNVDDYYAALEKLLLKAARINKELRGTSADPAPRS